MELASRLRFRVAKELLFYLRSTCLEIVLFGIEGFLIGFFVFTLLWSWPVENSRYRREIVRSTVFWCAAFSAGSVTATAFWVASNVLAVE
jgi:hypothetical protein